MIGTVRFVKRASRPIDGGRTVYTFRQDELVAAGDPRVSGGFLEQAVAGGIAVRVNEAPRSTEALDTPARTPDPQRNTEALDTPARAEDPERRVAAQELDDDEREPAKGSTRTKGKRRRNANQVG